MHRKKSWIFWKSCIGVMAIVGGTIVCGILGLMAGTLIGGNYAQDFTFLDVRGYEAAGLLGLIIGATTGGVLSLGLVLTYSKIFVDPPEKFGDNECKQ